MIIDNINGYHKCRTEPCCNQNVRSAFYVRMNPKQTNLNTHRAIRKLDIRNPTHALLFNFYRYSLLMHHTEEELRNFGLTEEMLIDQEW